MCKVKYNFYLITNRSDYHRVQDIIPIPIPKGCKCVVFAEEYIGGYNTRKAYAFCSKHDKIDINQGKWLAKQRLLSPGKQVGEADYKMIVQPKKIKMKAKVKRRNTHPNELG